MRAAPTTSEALLWQALRGSRWGVALRRQLVIGEYIADFVALRFGSSWKSTERTTPTARRGAPGRQARPCPRASLVPSDPPPRVRVVAGLGAGFRFIWTRCHDGGRKFWEAM